MSDAGRGEAVQANGATRTADEVLRGVDLRGRTALVTGAAGGLGAETARALAAAGAAVTIAARDVARGEAVAERIRHETGAPSVDVLALELTDLASVRAGADAWLAAHDGLDMLINNAGVMACPLARTALGHERQLATNHIGHFLLTLRLAEALRAAPGARVVNLSSAGHRLSGVDFDDPHYERRPYDKWAAYGQSKSANVLFTVELDRRLAPHGVRAFAVHPGMIITDLGRHLDKNDIAELMSRTPRGGAGLVRKTVQQGAATSVWAATAKELEGRGGLYCLDVRAVDPAAGSFGPAAGAVGPAAGADDLDGVAPHAIDPAAAARLWSLSEQWVGERFVTA